MARQVQRRWLYAAVPLATLLLVLLLGEVVIRAYLWARGWTPNCYAASLDLYQPHAERGNDLKPGFRLRSGVFQVTTNSLGLRGSPISPKKGPGVTRIVLLGGSSAFGYLVNDGQEAAHLLGQRLRGHGFQVEVINGAVPGYNLHQTVSRFQERIAPLEPDIVVLYLGWNDLRYICSEQPDQFRKRPVSSPVERLLGRSALYGLVAYRLLGGTTRAAPDTPSQATPTAAGQARFQENLVQLAEAVRQCNARLVVCTQCMAAHPEADDVLRAMVSSDPQVVNQMIRLGQWLRNRLRDFAVEHDAEFVDVYATLSPDTQVLADYIHLTVEGERQLASLLEQRIEPLLEEPGAGPGC